MGHHIDSEGRFQSDKYPDLGPDKVVVSFNDHWARQALRCLGYVHLMCGDREFGRDVLDRVTRLEGCVPVFGDEPTEAEG